MRKFSVLILLLTSACSTPLPCGFNDTAECEARWGPVMQQQMQPPMPMYFPPPRAPHPPAYGAPGNPAYCHAQPAGYNTMITCQ